MTIDLSRFSQTKTVVVPIINGWGKFGGRVIRANRSNGWYLCELGDDIKIIKQASQLEIEDSLRSIKKLTGIPLGNQFFPINFSNLESIGFAQTVDVEMQAAEEWDFIKVALWEDNRFYFVGVDYRKSRRVIDLVRMAYEKESNLVGIRGVTPELRYYFMVISLQRDGIRKMIELERMKLSEAEKKKRLEEFRKTFSGRLQNAIENAGGSLVSFVKRGSSYLVTWKVGGQKLKTTIRDDMRVLDLGFCASDEDRKHTLSSAINLAKMYLDEGGVGLGGLYITRE